MFQINYHFTIIYHYQKFKAGRYGHPCRCSIRIRYHSSISRSWRNENDVTTNGSHLNLVSMPGPKLQGNIFNEPILVDVRKNKVILSCL